MSGAIPSLLPYAFMAWTASTLPHLLLSTEYRSETLQFKPASSVGANYLFFRSICILRSLYSDTSAKEDNSFRNHIR